jgi:hypothetical protein
MEGILKVMADPDMRQNTEQEHQSLPLTRSIGLKIHDINKIGIYKYINVKKEKNSNKLLSALTTLTFLFSALRLLSYIRLTLGRTALSDKLLTRRAPCNSVQS